MKARVLIACTIWCFAEVGCSSVVSVRYDREHALGAVVSAATPQMNSVAVGAFVDDRSHDKGTNWVGAIRGGYGNPLKNLIADQTVPELIESAFTEGLKVRGLLAGPADGLYVVSGSVEELVASQVVTPEASARIAVTVNERTSGGAVFSKRYTAEKKASANLVVNGVFGSVDDLRQVLANALTDAVDQALDDPAFRAAIGATGSTTR